MTMMSGENKTNRTRGTKSIAEYFSKITKETSISQEAESTPLSLTDSNMLGVAEGVAIDVGQNRSREDVTKGAEPVNIISNSPNQPSNFHFPKTGFGKQSRSFQSAWFRDYPWLHYDEKKDSAFCYICINQNEKGNLKSARNMDEAFISKGFSNWKKALLRFQEHQTSQCHQVAVEYEMVIPRTHGNIVDMTSTTARATREENRRCLAKIIESLQYLARQGIAFRGDDDKESNFIQLLKLRAKDDKDLANWLSSKGDKYTSHDIQNELIGIMANQVVRDLVGEIKNNYFSLICDEYTDVDNKEQLTFCLRWIDENIEAHEDFIGFYQISNIEADTITSAIKDALTRLQLSLNECRGQCYDGASNMLGKKSGVAKQISDLQPKAFATHCHAHSLSLSVKDTVKDCQLLSHTMDTAKELVMLIKYSPKRETILGDIKENIEEESCSEERIGGILKLCPTRWTVRAACYERILANYASLFKLWEVCLEKRVDPDVRARIIGCDAQMKTFDFFFGLHLSQRLFAHTDNLSRSLQSANLSAAAGQNLAYLTVQTLESIRSETSFNSFYETVLIKAKEHPVISEPAVPRKRRAPSRYEVGTAGPTYPSTARDHYRKLYFEAVDYLTSSIKERFNQPAFKVYATLETLLLKAANGEDTSKEVDDLASKYSGDVNVNSLVAQLSTFHVLMRGVPLRCFEDILTKVKGLQPNERQFIDNVVVVCKLINVNPATSATGERSFSTARRIKTWLRSRMLQARFNHLAILNTHKERLDKLCLVSVANSFVSLNENRQRNFGKFDTTDFTRC